MALRSPLQARTHGVGTHVGLSNASTPLSDASGPFTDDEAKYLTLVGHAPLSATDTVSDAPPGVLPATLEALLAEEPRSRSPSPLPSPLPSPRPARAASALARRCSSDNPMAGRTPSPPSSSPSRLVETACVSSRGSTSPASSPPTSPVPPPRSSTPSSPRVPSSLSHALKHGTRPPPLPSLEDLARVRRDSAAEARIEQRSNDNCEVDRACSPGGRGRSDSIASAWEAVGAAPSPTPLRRLLSHSAQQPGNDTEASPPNGDELNAPYFHGHISRTEAETALRRAGLAPGLFLVREKDRGRLYALSVVVKGNVQHHLVECRPAAASGSRSRYLFNGKELRHCASIADIIDMLRALRGGDGACVLGEPCARAY